MINVDRYDFEDYGTLESDGRYVKYEDYLALQAERDQLAAKNVAHKVATEYLCSGASSLVDCCDGLERLCDVVTRGVQQVKELETPATDAWQREQMAKGVEIFSEQQRSYIGNPSKNDAASSYCSREALKFATQIRQGELS